MEERTTRQKVESLVESSIGGITPTRIASYFDEEVEPPEVYDHLEHIVETRDDLLARPPECNNCGFNEFRKIVNLPSNCPECRSEWIEEPAFKVEE